MNLGMNVEMIFRILIAAICGIFIGMERRNRAKEAGIRTHCVVACGAALMMVISKYGFFDMLEFPGFADTKLDPARVAAQIVSGVGFLGAGIIFIQKKTVTGLTTAAGIWATSGIGMAIGAGLYLIGIASTFVLLSAQILLHKNPKWVSLPKCKTLSVYNVTEPDFQQYAMDLLSTKGISVQDTYISKNQESRTYKFSIEVPSHVCEEEIIELFPHNCSLTLDA